MSKSKSSAAAVADTPTTQGKGPQPESPTAIIDPPGDQPEELDDRERGQYEILVKGFREALRICNAVKRQEVLAEVLKATESDPKLTRLWWHVEVMKDALAAIGHTSDAYRSPTAIALALQTVMAEVRKTLDPADELKGMEASIRDVVSRMDPKARTIAGILVELASLEGLSIGVDFGHAMVYEDLTDSDAIEKTCKELADDPDVQIMAKAHALDNQIGDAEAEDSAPTQSPAGDAGLGTAAECVPPSQEITLPGDDEPEQAEPQEQEQSPENKVSLSKAGPGFKFVVEWLLECSSGQRLAVALSHELLSHESEIKRNGQYQGDIGNDLLWDYNNEVCREIGNPDYFDSPDDLAIAGYLNGLGDAGA